MKNYKSRTEKFGEVRPIIHANYKGQKFVGVGNRFYYSERWKTFPDFLYDLLKDLLTPDWCLEEQSKPEAERHPIILWAEEIEIARKQSTNSINGLVSILPSGAATSFLNISYDLYTLKHHSVLQDVILNRLKSREQFQSVKYELMVAATFIRAGFDIALEDESDRSKKHPEFIAQCRRSREKIAVEAKSRRRPGVLAEAGIREDDSEVKVSIGRQINRALAKKPSCPYIIFVDINMPPTEASLWSKPWFKQLVNSVVNSSDKSTNSDQFNAIVFTNFSYHYASSDESAKGGEYYMVVGNNPPYPISNSDLLVRIFEATGKYGNVPQSFDEAD